MVPGQVSISLWIVAWCINPTNNISNFVRSHRWKHHSCKCTVKWICNGGCFLHCHRGECLRGHCLVNGKSRFEKCIEEQVTCGTKGVGWPLNITRCPLPTFTAVTSFLVDITVVEQSIAANSGEWYVKAIHSPILSIPKRTSKWECHQPMAPRFQGRGFAIGHLWSTGSVISLIMESPPKHGYFPHSWPLFPPGKYTVGPWKSPIFNGN